MNEQLGLREMGPITLRSKVTALVIRLVSWHISLNATDRQVFFSLELACLLENLENRPRSRVTTRFHSSFIDLSELCLAHNFHVCSRIGEEYYSDPY